MKKYLVIAGLSFVTITFIISCKNKSEISIPKPDHVVIVIEENHSYDQIMYPGNAPYFDTLAKEGALFTNSHAITHPSQPNYLAFFSGSTQGVTNDHYLGDITPFTTPNLGAELIKAGYTFKGYAEMMPNTGFLGRSFQIVPGHDYRRKHAPWVNWLGNKANGLPDSVSQPLTAFPADYSKLPTVSFVIPNEANDMHNIGLYGDTVSMQRASQWVSTHLSGYINRAKTHNSLFILTFDEDQSDNLVPNQIPTIFVGEMVKPGKYDDSIDHYTVLRTLEAMYDLPPIANAKKAKPITKVWK